MTQQGRFREIDWLRGYAVTLVLVMHVAGVVAHRTPLDDFFKRHLDASVGVDVFFAISGFVISRALAGFWDGEPRGRGERAAALAAFVRRRFRRLWPASTLWLTLCLAGAVLFRTTLYWPAPEDMLRKWVAGLLYVFNFHEYAAPGALGYYWSLSVEWQFYLLFPVFLLLVRGDLARVLALAGLFVLAFALRPGGEGWWMFRFQPILCGVAVYMLLVRERLPMLVPIGRPSPAAAALVTGFLLLAPTVLPFALRPEGVAWAVVALVCGGLVALAALDRGWISPFGLPRFLDWLGSRSYSLYLCHVPVSLAVLSLTRWLVKARFGRPVDYALDAPAMTLAALGLTALAAEATYRVAERPFLKPAAPRRPAPDARDARPQAAPVAGAPS